MKQVQHPPGRAGDGVTQREGDEEAHIAGQLSKR